MSMSISLARAGAGAVLQALVLCVVLAAAVRAAIAVEYNHHNKVPVLVNNVGPYNNPAESYRYYSLPYCAPQEDSTKGGDAADGDAGHKKEEEMGEVLAGDSREKSLYDVRFLVREEWHSMCSFVLKLDEIKAFRHAIENNYIFEMFVDGLPVKGFVGEIEHTSTRYSDQHVHNETHYYLFTHLHFSVAYNGPHVIGVNLTTDAEQRLELEFAEKKQTQVEFSYSVEWVQVDVPYVDRYFYHHANNIGDQSVEIHWLSIANSMVLVVLLVALLAIIFVHVLKKDIARYMEFEEEDGEGGDDATAESGWKLVHGDVFRFPPYVMLFSSCIGCGAQLLLMTVIILAMSVLGTFYPGNRGSVYTALLLLYMLTSFASGYVSSRLYVQLGGEKWASNALLTACLFAVPFFVTFSFVNSFAWYYGSQTALPAGTILLVIFGWALVTVPATVFGAMRGRKNAGVFDAPCKTTRAEREIPPAPWYRGAFVQYVVAGFLPFSAIYIELHYVFASVWGHRVYTLFGILSLAFALLVLVTAFITVALTYFQLAIEDHRWWWRSYLSGAATGLFVYGYACFYFVYRSDMTGVLQGTFFFGYMLMIAYGFALMLGAVSYWSAEKFVKYIYLSIHID